MERATRLAGGPAGPPHARGHQNMPPACFSRFARALFEPLPDRQMQRNTILKDGVFFGAGDEARTRYLDLGKVALYQMSYARRTMVIIVHNMAIVKDFFHSFRIISMIPQASVSG